MPTGVLPTGQADAWPAVDGGLASAVMSDFLALPADPPLAPTVSGATDHPAGWVEQVGSWVTSHPSIVGGLVVAAVLAAAFLVAWARGRVTGWIVAVSWIAAFGFSAEGMWYVATDKAHVPPIVAAGVFFVFELFQVRSMLAARTRYRATTVRAADGTVTRAGDPGKHGAAVWILALVMGGVVALAAHNLADAALRLSIPLGAALLWWNDLTDEGVVRARSSWRWTPRRLLLAVGAIEPGERDFETVDWERRVAQMTVIAHKLHHGSARLVGWRAARLRRLTLAADDAMVAEVRRRVERVHAVEEATKPRVVDCGGLDDAPGVDPAAPPGTDPGEIPGDAPGRNPGDAPGRNPGGNMGNTPGVGAGISPGAEVEAAPGIEPAHTRVPTRVRPPSPKQVKALKLRAQHPDMSAAEIARKVGADYKTVRGWLAKAAQPTPDLPIAPPAVPVTAGANGHAFHPSTTTPKES